MNLSKLIGLSKIEIIKYIYNQLKHKYPLKIEFYTKMFYLNYDLLYLIFEYFDLESICNIGKIAFLYLYYLNPKFTLFIQFHSYLFDFLNNIDINFNKEWILFSDEIHIKKYKKIYFNFLSFKKINEKITFYMYISKITTTQQRKKILEKLEKCNCYYEINDQYKNFEYKTDYDDKYCCPCLKIKKVINQIEEDLYYFKLHEEFDEYDKLENKENKENEENKYLHISELLSQNNYEELELSIEDRNDWIYYDID